MLAAIIQVEAPGPEQTVVQNAADNANSETTEKNALEQARKQYRKIFGTTKDYLERKKDQLSTSDLFSDYYTNLIDEISRLENDLKNGKDSREEELLKLSIDEINDRLDEANKRNEKEGNILSMYNARYAYERTPTSANRRAYETAMNALGLSTYLPNVIDMHAPNATEEDRQVLYDAVKGKTAITHLSLLR